MKIEHLAIWVNDLEKAKAFYLRFFDAVSNKKYHNPKKQFTSYFISFSSGCRLELMHRPDVAELRKSLGAEIMGLTHFAVQLRDKDAVNTKTEEFRAAGYTVAGEPRTTGDGYYESVILDGEGNRIELMA